jgi:hypothetical protein
MKKIIIVAVLCCFVLPQLAFAGAWTLPKGDVWVQQQMKLLWATKQFSPGSDLSNYPRDARPWGWAMIPEVNYGVTDWLDLLFKMEYKEGHYKEYDRPNGWGPYSVKNHGLVTIDPGIKIRFLNEPMVLSGQFIYSIWNDKYEGLPLDDVAEAPGLSDRTNYWELRGLAGKKWDTKIPFYMGLEWGYRANTRNVVDQMPLFYEVGFWPLKFLLIKTELDCMFGLDGTTKGDRVMEKSWAIWRIGPSIELLVLYDMLRGVDVTSKQYTNNVTRTGKSINIEAQYGNTFWGRNTAANQEVVLKVSAQF